MAMATCSVPDDFTSICSVCLEPYKERDPKLLPCFHTFCLPCLKDLEMHHLALGERKVCEDDEGGRSVTFPCPTSRAEITVPPGGVSQFQSNFYFNEKTHKCDTCKRDQEAKYNCTDCGHNMCTQCQQFHDIFNSNHQVQPLVSGSQQTSLKSHDADFEQKRSDQLAVLEAALVTMREEGDSLQRERQVAADVISKRADAVRELVTQSEEKSQRALEEVAVSVAKQIQNKITIGLQKHARIATIAFSEEESVLLCDDDYQYYQQQCHRERQTMTLQHKFNDCAIDLQVVEAYIGTVCGEELPAGETSLHVEADVYSDTLIPERPEDILVMSQSSDITIVTCGFSDIEAGQVAVDASIENLERQNKTVFKTETDSFLKDENFKLQQNIAAFQQNMDSFTQNILNIQKDMATMRQEFETMKADNLTLQNVVDSIKQEFLSNEMTTNEVKNVVSDLCKDLTTFKEKSSMKVAFNARLQSGSEQGVSLLPGILVLGEVICNVGQAYNNKTGIFITPVTGIYFFMARAMSTKRSASFYLDIFVNETQVAESLSTDGNVESGMSCTVHVVQRLTKGQKVSLRAGDNKLFFPAVSLRSHETSFSGVLVRQD